MNHEPDSGMTPIEGDELYQLHGGIFRSIFSSFIFHIGVEAYNDWGGHVDAFNEGREQGQTVSW